MRSHLSLLALSLALVQPSLSQSPLSLTALSSLLAAPANDSILGSTLFLSPSLNLSLLTNTTHEAVAFTLTPSVEWLAIGYGTAMKDAAMVLLYPTDASLAQWTLSLRCAGGHDQPKTAASPDAATLGAFQFLGAQTNSSLTGNGNANTTLVSFIRPLQLSSSQTAFQNAAYLNVSRSAGQRIIWALGTRSPSDPTKVDAQISQHSDGNFGTAVVDLSVPFSEVPQGVAWTRFDTVVYVHAGLGMITWLLVAPVAVLIGRMGRKWSSWFKWHRSMQVFVTLPLTILVIILGAIASQWGFQDGLDSHKSLGFLLLIFLFVQLSLGQYAHIKFTPNRETRPWYNVSHILLGLTLLLGGWLQIWLGFSEYQSSRGGQGGRAASLVTLFFVLIVAFLIFYVFSLTLLIRSRHAEGRSWSSSVLGLGRSSASAAPSHASHSAPGKLYESGGEEIDMGHDSFRGIGRREAMKSYEPVGEDEGEGDVSLGDGQGRYDDLRDGEREQEERERIRLANVVVWGKGN